MKLDQLLYFREVARHEHIGKTAKLLSISPSAISHSIAALEDELGHALFERHGKSIHLTEHGKLLAERVSPILSELDALKSDLTKKSLPLRGFYKIAAAHQLSPEVVAPACFEMQKKHPDVRVEIQTFRSSLVLEQTLSRQIDLGICYSPQEHPELAIRSLKKGQLRIMTRRDHPLLRVPAKDRVKFLSTHPCVMSKPSHGIQVCETHAMFLERGIVLNSTTIVDHYELAMQKMLKSDAWGFLPDWLIGGAKGKLAIVTLPGVWDAPYTIAAIWHRRQKPSRGIEELLGKIELILRNQ